MRAVLYILTTIAVVALAFWAYRENYATQTELRKMDKLHSEIRQSHARLAVLRAEWAYQNRPDRLQNLVDLNFESLGLMALKPEQFGLVDQISYPPLPIPLLDIQNSVEVSTMNQPAEVSQ